VAGLLIVAGEPEGAFFPLAERPLVGGRDPAAEIQLLDPKVSRRHFRVRAKDGGHWLLELRATNRVYLNGARLAGETRLADGDEIRVGSTLLAYTASDLPEALDALRRRRRLEPKWTVAPTERE
jgi:pSer/pThr/pTyr-binding forkhead associated (FHA) protein